ncbi:MAG: MATE family efflux transporter [Lachnospiraceae bacterium]|nr:MATE family efflux transporter [Lachnospiraceae bacterium]
MTTAVQTSFFSKDRSFYKRFIIVMLTVTLQNVVAYSVNMADNIMLGSFSQNALSGAATVNQIFFMVQQLAVGIGDTLVIVGSQYWGKKDMHSLRKVSGAGLKLALGGGILMVVLCSLLPSQLMAIFTTDAAIAQQGMEYMRIVKYTFLLFLITQALLATLRSVETVQIAFTVSIISLCVNCSINYCLIFGKFGFPQLGITGAAIGTLISRFVELVFVLIYILKVDKKLCLFSENPFKKDPEISRTFSVVAAQVLIQELVWAISIPLQSAIIGHLSSDAIAANSIATTFYQYLKVIARAMASATGVMIGSAIGKGDMNEVKAEGRTINIFAVTMGVILGLLLYALHTPLLSLYKLTPEAYSIANQLMLVMAILMVAMSYQMPILNGIIRGGGDTKFTMWVNMGLTWAVVVPLSFLSAFVWHLPVALVVLISQCDQILKCPIVLYRFRSYKWIRKLTKNA